MKIVPVSDIPTTVEPVPADPMQVFKTCKEMEILCRDKKGLGISAVQVGIPWNLFIVNNVAFGVEEDGWRHFVDCVYQPVGEKKIETLEGCLSLPGRNFLVKRWTRVKVTGQELVVQNHKPQFVEFAEEFDSHATGAGGTVMQHEVDHAFSILIDSHGQEIFLYDRN